jgi:hypothetical protein
MLGGGIAFPMRCSPRKEEDERRKGVRKGFVRHNITWFWGRSVSLETKMGHLDITRSCTRSGVSHVFPLRVHFIVYLSPK